MAISFVFINSFSKIAFFFKKKKAVKIQQCCSSGEEVKLDVFMYFPWPPFKAGLSISTFFFN